ncbi:MAG: hypothetical protein WA110_00235, partial [Anaerolineaceae bacterium]
MDDDTQDLPKPSQEDTGDTSDFSELNNFREYEASPSNELAGTPENDTFPELEKTTPISALPREENPPAENPDAESAAEMEQAEAELPKPESDLSRLAASEVEKSEGTIPELVQTQSVNDAPEVGKALPVNDFEFVPEQSETAETAEASVLPSAVVDAGATPQDGSQPLQAQPQEGPAGPARLEQAQPAVIPGSLENTASMPNQTQTPGSDQAELWFSELSEFKEVNVPSDLGEASPLEPTQRADFFTGHWSLADQDPPSASATRMLTPTERWTPERALGNTHRSEDDIPTISPVTPPGSWVKA